MYCTFLNYCIGDDVGTIHSKTELRKMLALHVQHGAVDADSGIFCFVYDYMLLFYVLLCYAVLYININTGHVLDGALTFRDTAVKDVVSDLSGV